MEKEKEKDCCFRILPATLETCNLKEMCLKI